MVKPKTIRRRVEDETLRTVFDAIVDYHNNMTQTRFTIAGLYIAATGFLASSWFSGSVRKEFFILIPIVGFFFTVICWLLEFRTRHLLDNVGRKGIAIERLLGVRRGFFARMETQPYSIKLPFDGPKIRYTVGHTLSLNLLYAITSIFWFYLFFQR
jgi:hypothetical protein